MRVLVNSQPGNCVRARAVRDVSCVRSCARIIPQGRAPVVSACNEYLASLALAEAGVDTLTPAAYGRRGHNPAAMESFLITDDLVGTVSLEDYCRGWPDQPPPVAQKRRLLNKVMWMAATMHGCGINHRDFYLCHPYLLWGH